MRFERRTFWKCWSPRGQQVVNAWRVLTKLASSRGSLVPYALCFSHTTGSRRYDCSGLYGRVRMQCSSGFKTSQRSKSKLREMWPMGAAKRNHWLPELTAGICMASAIVLNKVHFMMFDLLAQNNFKGIIFHELQQWRPMCHLFWLRKSSTLFDAGMQHFW